MMEEEKTHPYSVLSPNRVSPLASDSSAQGVNLASFNCSLSSLTISCNLFFSSITCLNGIHSPVLPTPRPLSLALKLLFPSTLHVLPLENFCPPSFQILR
ncbi:hypothetical protein GDO81_021228 [Engystomops pustulosus]|uniref:Uncharacterized protein n=1 Tax=Engystomops pustulosus TaxID=76066 RepID=A0AAV6ZCX2_ENGPU|nr:hypothetical protein GDO81_021228 [Engystomops pustulosus]